MLLVAVNKIPDINNTMEKKLIWDHGIRGLVPWLTGHCFGSEVRQSIMVELGGRRKLPSLWKPEIRAKKKGAQDMILSPKACLQ